MISFQARKINSVNIQKLNSKTNEYEPKTVSCVKLCSCKDYHALKDLRFIGWDKSNYYYLIFSDYADKRRNVHSKAKVYVLTTQTKDLTHLDPSQIIGLADVYQKKHGVQQLKYIETMPEYAYGYAGAREYKGVGSALLNSLIKRPFQKELFLYPKMGDPVSFFEKVNLIHKDSSSMKYINSFKERFCNLFKSSVKI